MKATTTTEAIQKVYAAGTLSTFGKITFEGIGNRKTNWGIGITIGINGPIRRYTLECLEWFSPKTYNKDSNRNAKQTSFKMTTIEEGATFCTSIGCVKLFNAFIEQVKEHDAVHHLCEKHRLEGGRIHDKSETIRLTYSLSDSATDIEIAMIEEMESMATFDALNKAFEMGKRGLTISCDEFYQIKNMVEIAA